MPSKITKRTIKQIGGKSKKNVKKINKKSSGKIQKKINKKTQKKIMLTKKRLFKKYIGGGTGVKKKITDVYNKNNKIYIYAGKPDKRKIWFRRDIFRTGVKDTIEIEDILYEINEIKSNKLIDFDKQFVKDYDKDGNNKTEYTIIETESGKSEEDIIQILEDKMKKEDINKNLLEDARARLVAEAEAEPEAEPTPSPTQSHSQSQSESNSEESLSSGEEEEDETTDDADKEEEEEDKTEEDKTDDDNSIDSSINNSINNSIDSSINEKTDENPKPSKKKEKKEEEEYKEFEEEVNGKEEDDEGNEEEEDDEGNEEEEEEEEDDEGNEEEEEDDEGNEEAESRSEEKSKLNPNAHAFEPNSNRLNSSANQKLDTIPEEPEEAEAAAEELSKNEIVDEHSVIVEHDEDDEKMSELPVIETKGAEVVEEEQVVEEEEDDEDEEKKRQQKINMYENQINNFDDLDGLEKLKDSNEFELDMIDEQIKEKIEGKIRERRKKIFKDKLNDIDDIDDLKQWKEDSEVDRLDDKELENLLKERQKVVFIKNIEKMDKVFSTAREKKKKIKILEKKLEEISKKEKEKDKDIRKTKEKFKKNNSKEEKLKVAKILVQLKGLKKKYKTRKKTEGKNLLKSKKEYKDSFKPFYIKEFYENSDKQEQEKWIIDHLNKNPIVGGKKKKILVKKIVRKHRGIIQTGGNKGRLRKGYKYIGKKLKSGLPQIIKCRINKF